MKELKKKRDAKTAELQKKAAEKKKAEEKKKTADKKKAVERTHMGPSRSSATLGNCGKIRDPRESDSFYYVL